MNNASSHKKIVIPGRALRSAQKRASSNLKSLICKKPHGDLTGASWHDHDKYEMQILGVFVEIGIAIDDHPI